MTLLYRRVWKPLSTLLACAVASTATLLHTAAAQDAEALRERYIAQCRAQYLHLKKEQGQDIAPLVKKCVRGKFDAMHAQVSAQDLHLSEFDFWLTQKRTGPDIARGVIYYIRGYSPGPKPAKDMNFGPFFLSSLSESGWDVIAAQLPLTVAHTLPTSVYVPPGVRFARKRVKELKAQGYKRVVLAGHSWGGWVAMEAAATGPLEADLLIANAPAAYGKRKLLTGEVIDETPKNMSEFSRMLNKIDKPIVLMHFLNDEFETGDRGAIAAAALAKKGIPALIVDKPSEFVGHYVSNFPIFDYAFGKCMAAFLEAPATRPCDPQPLAPTDFRAVLRIEDVPDHDAKSITSPDELTGKTFVIYRFGGQEQPRYARYISRDKRKDMRRNVDGIVSYTFRDGIHCAGGKYILDLAALIAYSALSTGERHVHKSNSN